MIKTRLLDPDVMMAEDVIADDRLAPEFRLEDRVPLVKAYLKGAFPDRKPDIETPRTDVYILGWNPRYDDRMPRPVDKPLKDAS